MPSKSNVSNLASPSSAWWISAGAHFLAIGVVVALMNVRRPLPQKIEFEVLDSPKEAPKALMLSQPKADQAPAPPKSEQRKVFGVSRKALTDEAGGEAVKQGNTVATVPDNEKLRADDADSLPIPTDEYLVTSMPVILSEVRVDYPAEAKAKGIEGPVVLDLLIDASGRVREVILVSGPGGGLEEAAMNAVRRFQFKPAMVESQPVAVKIRYTYRFVLER